MAEASASSLDWSEIAITAGITLGVIALVFAFAQARESRAGKHSPPQEA